MDWDGALGSPSVRGALFSSRDIPRERGSRQRDRGQYRPAGLIARGDGLPRGFYVERAYETLGITAERILGLTEPDGGETAEKERNESNGDEPSGSLVSFVLLPTQRRQDHPRWYED